jgi:hypothetical protein
MSITNPPPASSSPEKLEEIFQRIHDNVYSRSLLSDQTKLLLEEYSNQIDALLLPTLPPDLLEKITAIRNVRAPYYVVSGNPLTKIIKSLHNLVLKFFGRKQAYYNSLTLDLIESMAAYLQALQEHSKTQSSRLEALTTQMMLQTEQFATLQIDYQKMVFEIKQVAVRQHEAQELKEQIKPPTSQLNEKQ